MDIPLNVDVHCPDGRYGRSTYVILNPTTEQVTHVVVRENNPPHSERLVPVGWVKETTPDLILLNYRKGEVNTLDLFNQTDFVQRDVPHYATDPKVTLLWPYVVPAKKIVSEAYPRIPPGELAIHRGTPVRATDGRIGQVDEFMVDLESGHITHLVLRTGHLWGQREVTIPLSEIKHIDENVIHLKLDKQAIEALPSIPVRRR